MMAERKTEVREMGEFTRVSMRGVGKLFIQQGKKQEVTIEGDEVALSRITTNAADGRLVIDIGRDWVEKLSAGLDFFSSHDIRIHITMKEVEELEVTGAAEVEAKDIKTDDLSLRMTGASNVRVSNLRADSLRTEMPGAGRVQVDGKVKDQIMTLAGAGNFSAHDLESKTAKVVLSGVGSAQLWVTDELDVTIAGVGSVEYFGSPAIKQSVAMLGKVSSLGDHK
jgi:hypothetical protein